METIVWVLVLVAAAVLLGWKFDPEVVTPEGQATYVDALDTRATFYDKGVHFVVGLALFFVLVHMPVISLDSLTAVAVVALLGIAWEIGQWKGKQLAARAKTHWMDAAATAAGAALGFFMLLI
jgi:hypothetical protein